MGWLDEHWGDIISAIGLAVSLGGFSIAIWQIMRSRRAAEAAGQAVKETKQSLTRNLTISDLTRAAERLEAIKELHRQREWRRAIDRYYDMRIMLSEIGARHPSLSDDEKSTIQSAIRGLNELEVTLSNALTGGEVEVERYSSASEGALVSTQSLLIGLASDLEQSL